MIPKIIHYSWFSGDPYPEPVRLYMETWKRVLPDYEFVLWDMERAKEIDTVFFREAIQERKWAFAADYLRCYAVYKYGGIWLDIDIEMRKSFNNLLHHKMFIGMEGNFYYFGDGVGRHMHTLTSHCFGAEAGHLFLKRCLDHYKDRHFVLSDDRSLPERLRYDMRILPDIQACLANAEFGYDGGMKHENEVVTIDDGITVLPSWCLEQPKYHPEEDAICIHHFFGAWRPENYGREYDQKGLYKAPPKNLDYYVFTFLNKIMRRRGYVLKVMCIGK